MIYLTHQVKKGEKLVLHYLTDMQKFVLVHPYLEKVELLGRNHYKVYEKQFLSGFVPIYFSYPATVEYSQPNKSVTITARIFSVLTIVIVFKVNESEGVTTINETIEFFPPFPVKFFLEKLFIKSHTRLFYNIGKEEGV